ncbi:MAG: ATP-dependent zinc metalloprotease FtsH [Desulfuromonadales bacterium]|nr:ATP-dependent zinc metalloprotease FtsH [Desulfuromonadales bacterium]
MLQNPWHRFLLVMALVLAANSLYLYFNPQTEPEPVAEIAYSRFKNELRQGHVVAVTIEGTLLTGRFLDAISFSSAELVNTRFEGYRAYELFRTTLPPLDDPQLFQLLDNSQVVVEARQKQEPSPLSSLLVALLPWIIIFGVWVYILRRMREGGPAGRLLGQFGKSGAHLYMPKTSPVTFDDVAGLAEAKQELQDIIVFLRSPAKFTRLGGRVPRGILLVGPPGTGKTLMARAVAGEAGVPFYNISASQFIEMFVGVGASRVRDLFNNAKKNAPSIIFVDELDAVGRARGTGLGGGHDEREQTLNQLLSELDGFEPHDEVIVMAATNRPDVLDSALLRPGRFDRQVVIERPDWRDRVKILQVHTRKIPLAEDVDLARIAKGTPGMVGADLQSLVNEAALIAAREDAEQVDNQHLDQAKDRQLMGMERKLFLSDREKRITAYHEAGHTLVGRGLPGTDPVHKVTIIPRGQALGVTQQLPEDDRYQFQRNYLMGRLAVLLGGRAAEKMVFGEYSTGAQNDLKQVMELAEKMVCQWGMSERLGPLSLSRGEEHPFLGLKLATEKVFSEKTAWLIDQEIEKLITTAAECAERLLEMNRPLLDALATFLVEEETLDAERLAEIFAAAELKSPPGLLEMLGGKDG